ncbi:serine/threonine-protein kinase Pink1, mitochondrial-like [Antedon mediterranea]|uniref:serine/threonine-protein kinase Pink1, mitochondrial-like n=1 Tax=Antedon mediterranea TaxID=105859 RepID=UPI003AF5A568
MSFGTMIFMRTRQILGQLLKHRARGIQNEINHQRRFADRKCLQKRDCRDESQLVRRPSSNIFQRYGLFKSLPEANFKGFASVLRRSATVRLMASRDQVLGRGSLGLFAFVGISMVGTGIDSLYSGSKSCMEDKFYEDFCSKIRNSCRRTEQESKPDVPDHVSGYEFCKKPLGNGCNGLIFAARIKEDIDVETEADGWDMVEEEVIRTKEEDGWNLVVEGPKEEDRLDLVEEHKEEMSPVNTEEDDYPIAIKMTFNYFASSNSDDILRKYERELVPLNGIASAGKMTSLQLSQKKALKHPNVVDLYRAFVDDEYPQQDYILQHHPACLPSALNPSNGLGRNMTMFVTMKRYDMNLKQYLNRFGEQSECATMIMLTQLLEGITYLVCQGIAHRDLKSDNILVEIQSGFCRLVITDFGCCLVQDNRSLSLPYTSSYVDKGGNSALMAPEIKTAIPGVHSTINYQKSDAWSAATIAYEIVGLPNPFSVSQNTGSKRLDSRTYQESELPSFGDNKHHLTQMVCHKLLKRDPDERLSAAVAANIFHLFLWQPQYWKAACWSTGHVIPKENHVVDWLGTLYVERCMKRVIGTNVPSDYGNLVEEDLCYTFLQRVNLDSLMESVDASQAQIVKEFMASQSYNCKL